MTPAGKRPVRLRPAGRSLAPPGRATIGVMAVNRYVLTSDVTVGAGSASAVAGGLGIVSWSGPGPYPAVYPKGTVIALDPASAAYTAIGAGNLRALTDTDASAGRPGIAN